MGRTKIGISVNGSFSRLPLLLASGHASYGTRCSINAKGIADWMKEAKKDVDNNSLIIIYVAENYF